MKEVSSPCPSRERSASDKAQVPRKYEKARQPRSIMRELMEPPFKQQAGFVRKR